MSLLLALGAGALFAIGGAPAIHWAAGLFVLARFLDHFDCELARLTGQTSRFGYYFDYAVGGLAHAALFAGNGWGLAAGTLGGWALALGLVGATAALLAVALNLDLDRQLELGEGEAVGYPGWGRVELEDGIYLLAPFTLIGWLEPFFGAAAYLLWTLARVLRAPMPG